MIVGNRRVLHTRQSRKSFEQLLVKVIYLSRLRILGMGQRESGREHSFRLESRIHSLQQPEALNQKTRANHEHHGDTHLKHDELLPEPQAIRRRPGSASTLLERGV